MPPVAPTSTARQQGSAAEEAVGSCTVPAEDDARGPGDPARVSRLEILVVLVAVLVGAALRWWAPSPLWLDEALSVQLAELPLSDLPEALRQDGHPPMYYGLLRGWMSVFGESDASARALSALIGLLLLPVAWLLGREVGGARVAWSALALTAASPYAIRYSTEVRMYALVMLLAALGAYVVRRGMRTDARWPAPALALLTGALLLTHYWALWLGAATAAVLCAVAVKRPGIRPAALRLLLALGFGAVLFLPWLPTLLFQSQHTGTPWAPATRPSVMAAMTVSDLGGGSVRDAEVVGLLLVVLVLLGLLARPLGRWRMELDLRTTPGVQAEGAIVAVTLAVGATVGFVASATYASRYAAVVAPVILVMAAVGASRIGDDRTRAAVVAVVVLGGLGVAAVNATTERTQAAQHAEAIAATATAGDLVVVCPDQLGPSLHRQLQQQAEVHLEVVAYPLLDSGRRVDWVDYAQRNVVDPVVIATEIERRVDDDAAIFVAWSGDYRSLEGQCEALVAALGVHRADRATLVAADAEIYEHATLTRLAPGGTP